MPEIFPKDLKDAVHAGRVIPFAGAGVSMAVRRIGEKDPAYPNWKGFLLGAADQLDLERVGTEAALVRSLIAAKPPDFYQAAQRAHDGLGPRGWVQLLRQKFELDYNTIDLSTLELARTLWTLAPNAIITSNFDFTLRWACPQAPNLREWGLDDPHGYVELLENGCLDRPAVWHFHGMIQRPRDLVLAVDGYKRLYLPSSMTDAESRWKSALEALRQVLVTRTLLFVGFSFTDDYFTDEIEYIAKLYEGAGRTHYALVKEAEREALEARLAKMSVRCVRCIPYADHGQPLIDVLRDLATFRGGGGSPPTGGSPGATGTTSTTHAPSSTTPAPIPATTSPPQDKGVAASPAWIERSRPELEAMLLLGAWAPSAERDRDAVKKLGVDPMALERVCVELAALDDAPMRYDPDGSGRRHYTWSDPDRIWPLLVGKLPPTLLTNFSEVAREVLAEENPALKLPKEERFLAAVQGKVLGYSPAIREGISKSLVRIASSDDPLKPSHGTSRGSLLAHAVIYRVLEPEWRIWASLDTLLPFLAEAAPSTFLDRAEQSLALNEKGTPYLLGEETGFGASLHTGLLWALETLGWLPDLMPRVAIVLSRLAARDPGGKLANRPDRSLANLLHPLLPQSKSTAEERIAVLKLVLDREPSVGWKTGVGLLDGVLGPGTFMSPSRRPQIARWAIPEESTKVAPDARQQLDAMVELLIANTDENEERWSELLNPLCRMPAEMSKRVLSALLDHVPTNHDAIWAKVRELLHNAYQFGEAWGVHPESVQRLEEIYRQLTPEDPVRRYAWLFAAGRNVPERVEGGWKGEEQRLAELRAEAVADLWKRKDRWELFERLAAEVGPDWRLGVSLAESSFADDVENRLLSSREGALATIMPAFVARRHDSKGAEWLRRIVSTLIDAGRVDEASTILASLLPSTEVWNLIDECGETVRNEYWRKIGGVYGDRSPEEYERAIAGLLSVGRATLAIDIVSSSKDKIKPETALRVLEEMDRASEQEVERLSKDGSARYDLERVFEVVDRMGEALPVERVMQLEVTFLGFLRHTSRGARYVFSALGNQPKLFAEFVSTIYKAKSAPPRQDDSETEDGKKRKRIWEAAYRILEAWNGYPGQDKAPGERDSFIIEWTREALKLTAEADREQIGAHEVGKVLARAPVGTDGLWPSVPVREILKSDSTHEIANGVYIEMLNSRGVTSRALGEGGGQERKLSASFRESANALRMQWPEAAAVLDRLADSYQQRAAEEDAEAEADRHRYKLSPPSVESPKK